MLEKVQNNRDEEHSHTLTAADAPRQREEPKTCRHPQDHDAEQTGEKDHQRDDERNGEDDEGNIGDAREVLGEPATQGQSGEIGNRAADDKKNQEVNEELRREEGRP